MGKYGNWGRPSSITELKNWVKHWGSKTDITSIQLRNQYYRYYKNAGGKMKLRDILKK